MLKWILFPLPRLMAVLAAGLALSLAASCLAAPQTGAGASAGLKELQRLSDASAEVVAEVKPAVVTVTSETRITPRSRREPFGQSPFDDFFRRFFPEQPGPQGERRRQGLGSGVIVSSDGYILTNNHVIEGADEIHIELPDGREFEAEVVGTDAKTDLGVLKVKAKGELPSLRLGNSDGLRVGEWVLAIGNPFRLQHTVTFGIVSATGRGSLGLADYEDFIQTDAAINPGNSGGALVNLEGEVVGINTAIASQTGYYQGVGFAIPANMARNIMDQLIDTGEVRRGYLGVQIQNLTRDMADAMGLESTDGVLVSDVVADTAAAQAGLERGDIIVGLDGQPIKNSSELRNRIAQTPPGTTVRLRLRREGSERVIRVKLRKLDEESASGAGVTPSPGRLGLEVQELTRELGQRFGYEDDEGVLVSSVQPGSEAERKGLRAGDLIQEVDRKTVRSPAEYERALAGIDAGESVVLYVKRGERNFFLALRLPETE